VGIGGAGGGAHRRRSGHGRQMRRQVERAGVPRAAHGDEAE
jgi:hypothetical protein